MKINNKAGFLLLELLVTVSVLTTGIIFVFRSLANAQRLTARSHQFYLTSLQGEQIIWALEQGLEEKTGERAWVLDSQPWKAGLPLEIHTVTLGTNHGDLSLFTVTKRRA